MTGIDDVHETVRRLRELLGLTQAEMAARLTELAWSTHGVHVGVNADMVSKWERHQKRPNPLYAGLLRQLSASPRSKRRTGGHLGADSYLPGTAVLDAIGLLDTLGADADVLRPHLIDLMRDELSGRDGPRSRLPDLAMLALRHPRYAGRRTCRRAIQ